MPSLRRRENAKPISALLIVAFVVCLGMGCAGKVPQQTPFMKQVPGVTITSSSLKLLMYEYIRGFAAKLEFAADQIILEAETPELRKQALQWKVYGLSVMQAAAFQPDPLAALVDCWLFAAQMRDYFTIGKGKDIFGPHQHIAIAMSEDAVETMREIARATTDSGSMPGNESEARIDSFALAAPIENAYFVRRSIRPHLVRFTAGEIKGGLGGVGQINETVSDLSERISLYTELLPKQARWQADLVITERVGDPAIPVLMDDVGAIRENISDMKLAASEISESMEAVGVELTDEQMQQVEALLDLQLENVLEAVDYRREEIVEILVRERALILAEVDALTERSIQKGKLSADELIESLFVKALILVVLVFAGTLLLGLIFMRLNRKRRPAEG